MNPERVKEALQLIEDDYPEVAKWVRGSVAHLKVKYGGILAVALGACAVLEFVVGV